MKNPTQFSESLFELLPIVGILRGFTEEQVRSILPIYQKEGFTTIEITMNTAGAKDMIQHSIKAYGSQLNIGAGTVRTMEELNQALAVGAQFIVTPVLNPEVIKAAVSAGIPVFPGAYTPTEVFTAWQLGAHAVKIFPAVTGGLTHVKALRGPLDTIRMIPTGGVGAENIAAFFEAGVYGVGMGGQLFPKSVIAGLDWEALALQLRKVNQAYKQGSNV